MVTNHKKKLLHHLRKEYGNTPFLEESLKESPIEQFEIWFNEALKVGVVEPNGMILATSSIDGHPSTRTVLLKEYGNHGFSFFTGLESRKSKQLLLNPFASVTFWWKEIYRQIHIEGKIKKVPHREAKAYFAKRARGAQLAAHASLQSEPLISRSELEEHFHKQQQKYKGKKIPCSKDWVGYTLIPERIEFWQGRKNRLHDRIVYILANDIWLISRLAP